MASLTVWPLACDALGLHPSAQPHAHRTPPATTTSLISAAVHGSVARQKIVLCRHLSRHLSRHLFHSCRRRCAKQLDAANRCDAQNTTWTKGSPRIEAGRCPRGHDVPATVVFSFSSKLSELVVLPFILKNRIVIGTNATVRARSRVVITINHRALAAATHPIVRFSIALQL